MRIIFRMVLVMLLSGSFVTSLHGISYASSTYDNVVETVDSVKSECFNVNDGSPTGETIDLSNLWYQIIMGDLEQVQGKDVYIYSIDGSVGLTELRTTLSQRMADGKGWGISQLFVDNDTRAYSVELTIGDSSQSPLNFSTHYTGTPYLKSSSGYHASFYCRNDAFIVSFGRVNSSIEVAYSEPIYGATSKPWFLNFDINYPSGYEGTYAPTAPPAPPTTLYTGTVDCGGVDPAYVLIAQAGNTGPATMTPTTFGRADWSYNLTDDDYGIEVGCGDKIANSYALVSPATSSNDWVCNIIDDPHYCVLS